METRNFCTDRLFSELEDQAQGGSSPLSAHRRTVHQSIAPDFSPSMTSQGITNPPLVSVSAQSHHSNPVTIGSLVHPPNNERASMYGGTIGMGFDSQARSVYQIPLMNSSDESPYFYSSPESGQSPISDHYPRYNTHRSSLSSTSSIDMYNSTTAATPLIASTLPGWTPVIPANITTAHGLEDDINAISSVGILSEMFRLNCN